MVEIALIRAEGSKMIGLGHLSRACLISDMLQERFALKTKLIMKKDRAAEHFVRQRGIETLLLSGPASDKEEIESLQQIVETETPSLFVLDVLEQDLNTSYMKLVKKFGCPVVAITDDSNHRIIDADIILNGNPNQIGLDYSRESGRYLLGPMYFPMDPVYGDTEVKKPDGHVKKILLTFGGSDHNNILFRVLDALEKIERDLSVLVIVSKASGYLDRLQKYLEQLTFFSELHVDVSGLVPFWEECDLAITAAGNTLFERIATRLPGATLCQLNRQMEIANCFESLGVNVNLGFGPDISDDVLQNRIVDFIDNKELQRLQYQNSLGIIDGRGLIRLGNEIQSLLEEVL